MLNIAVIGAMCSGKTTLVDSYTDDERLSCTYDLGRQYLIKHPKADRTSISVCRQIAKAYSVTFKMLPNDKLTISDGCQITPVAHLLAYGKQAEARELLEEVIPELKTIQSFIILDINDVPYVTDEVRNEEVAFRSRLQDAYIQLAKELSLDYQIVSGSLIKRRAYVESCIKAASYH